MAGRLIEPEEGDHSSDEDFSPGHLVIDMEDEEESSAIDSTPDSKSISTGRPTTPMSTSSKSVSQGMVGVESPLLSPNVNRGIVPGDDFKGLTFVGKMDINNQTQDVPDTLCLYSYHWGPTHIDVITRKSGPSLVPVKNVYGRVVPGLTRNAVSNRIPKIGAKTIALPDTHINTLKKLQLPITARSHYLTISDFVKLCCYYKKTPPTNLSSFVNISSNDNPAEVLKAFNSQKPVISQQPVMMPNQQQSHLPQQQSQNGMTKIEPLFDQSDYSLLSPGQLNANLANSVGEVLQYATPYPLWNAPPPPVPTQTPPTPSSSKIPGDPTLSPTAGAEYHSLVLPDGMQIAMVIQNSTPYLLNAELQHLLPQANQNVIGPIRSLLNIPLEYASRPNMNALKEVGVIGIKACRSIVYKVSDVIKMYGHFRVPVPKFLHDLTNGKIPRGVVDMTPMLHSPPTSQPQQVATPISADMMSPSGVRINLGAPQPKMERKNSHSGQPPLDDQQVEYEYLPWGNDRSITLLKQPSGEPYVAIAELVDKVFSQRSQISLQKRTRLGIPTLPATSLQIHALRARGSIDPSSGYSKLVSLSGVLLLAREAGVFIPPNVYDECQKYLSVPLESLLSSTLPTIPLKKATPELNLPFKPLDHFQTPPTYSQSLTSPQISPHMINKPSLGGSSSATLPQLRDEIKNHPDVILPAKLGLRSAEGILYQVMWGKSKIVIFTSARGINYVGLYQIYDVLFKNLVSRMNFKMRMRKLGIKSIRAPPAIRLSLIKLGALPTSSPVCGLLRISEMDRLVRSYNMSPPTVFHDLFLSKVNDSSLKSDNYKDFCNPPGGSSALMNVRKMLPYHPSSMEMVVPHLSSSEGFKGRPEDSLVVSLPRALIVVHQYPHSQMMMSPHSHLQIKPLSQPGTHSKPGIHKSSVLQNLAKKISQKNHKLAASATRECNSCGRVYPNAKKRCEYCKKYLVGRPCPSCTAINYSRCTQCTSCGYLLDPSSFKSSKDSDASDHFQQAEEMNSSTDQITNFSMQFNSEDHDDTKSDDISETDSTSPLQSSFAPPPIRTAVLKKLFPNQKSPSGVGSSAGSSSVMTKTEFTGTVGSTRKCMECDAINSKMAKKCQQCKAPLQGRPCPRCSRPNHSHSTECYKCGAPLPPTATKWIVGGKIVRTNESSVVSGLTVTELNKEVSRRAPITCIRCERMKQKGRFKCGRCGDLFSLSPLLDSNGKIIKRKKHDHTHSSTATTSKDAKLPPEDLLLSLSDNLYMLGVGKELVPMLTEKEQTYWEMLSPAEEELSVAEEEYQKVAAVKDAKESEFTDIQAGLDALIVQAEKANKELNNYREMEKEAETTITALPDVIKNLEQRIMAINQLLEK